MYTLIFDTNFYYKELEMTTNLCKILPLQHLLQNPSNITISGMQNSTKVITKMGGLRVEQSTLPEQQSAL